jgi:predicted PurR-regulated permease PerM
MDGGKSQWRRLFWVYVAILSIILLLGILFPVKALTEEELETELIKILTLLEEGSEEQEKALEKLKKQFDLTEKQLTRHIEKVEQELQKAVKALNSSKTSFEEYRKKASIEIRNAQVAAGISISASVILLIILVVSGFR